MAQDDNLRLVEQVAQALQSAKIQARMHRNMLMFWSFGRLAREYEKAEVDMGHCLDAFVQYALSVERQIDLSPSRKLNIGQTVEEVLVSDRAMISQLVKLTQLAMLIRNPVAEVELLVIHSFARIKSWQGFLDKQLELVRQMGLSAYLSVVAEITYRPPLLEKSAELLNQSQS